VIPAAIPVAWTLTRLVWRKRLDPIGVFSVAAFGPGLRPATGQAGSS
jgi:hypothetical protein